MQNNQRLVLPCSYQVSLDVDNAKRWFYFVPQSETTGHMNPPPAVEEQIDQWRSYLLRRQAGHSVNVAELENHLREHLARLAEAGLAADEAFLVAVKRIGNLNALARDFARDHSDRLWKQLVIPSDSSESRPVVRRDAMIAFAVAV